MIVTNAAAIVYNRAHYAKPGDVVQRGRTGGHHYSEPPGQAERPDRGQGFPQDVFSDKVREHARDLASSASPRSLRVIKRQVYSAMFQILAEAFETSEREMLASLQREDFKEGVAHFLEMRAPAFSGR